MKFQIGLLILFGISHLVISKHLPRSIAIDDDKLTVVVVDENDYNGCILNCYLKTKKPHVKELCNKEQLDHNCKTLYNQCRCFKLKFNESNQDLYDSSSSALPSKMNVQNSFIICGFIIVIHIILNIT